MRNAFFDVVKAVAICLVVVGHASAMSEQAFPVWLSNLTIGVNMPIFFIISGYFCWKTVSSGDSRRLLRHLKSYLLPAVWIAFVFVFANQLRNDGAFSTRGAVIGSVKWFVFGPWFVWALAVCYVVAFASRWFSQVARVSPWIVFAATQVLLLFVPGCNGIVYKDYVRDMFPYFVFGGVLWQYGFKPWEYRYVGGICLLIFLGYLIAMPAASRDLGLNFYFNDTSWRAFATLRGTVCMFARPLIGLVGSVGLMWCVWEFCEWSIVKTKLDWVVRAVAGVGTCTLGIYLLHQWLLADILTYAPCAFASRINVLAVVSFLVLLCYGITWLTQNKLAWSRKWVWGK